MKVFRSLAIVVAILGMFACAASPEERYTGAVEAGSLAFKSKDQKSTADERLEDYLLYFTKASAELLRSANQVADRITELSYVDDVRTILPKAKAKKVEVRGNLAILTMKADDSEFSLYMVQEKGNWVIDIFSLKSFWQPIDNTEGG